MKRVSNLSPLALDILDTLQGTWEKMLTKAITEDVGCGHDSARRCLASMARLGLIDRFEVGRCAMWQITEFGSDTLRFEIDRGRIPGVPASANPTGVRRLFRARKDTTKRTHLDCGGMYPGKPRCYRWVEKPWPVTDAPDKVNCLQCRRIANLGPLTMAAK